MKEKQDVTRIVPDIKVQKVNRDKLKLIMGKTISCYLDSLKNNQIQVPMAGKIMVGTCESDATERPVLNIDFPCYDRIDRKELMAPGDTQGINDFYAYMWEKGAFKISLTGPDPGKEDWKPYVFERFIKTPVINRLSEGAHDQAVKEGKIILWNLPVTQKSDLINKIVDQIVTQKIQYIAKCPLFSVNHSGKSKGYKLANNIYLKLYSAPELLLHVSKYRDIFDSVDSQAYLFDGKVMVIEIAGSISSESIGNPKDTTNKPVSAKNRIENDICDTLDVCKWALMSGNAPMSNLREGGIIYSDTIGNRLSMRGGGFFQRQPIIPNGRIYNFNDIDLTSVKLWIKKARKAIKQLPDLKQAFWYWGRSYVSQTDRDALLDAVIGLERLLVSSGEEGGVPFKFSLYGTVLLAEEDGPIDQIKNDLKEIYEKRGAGKSSLGFAYLSRALFRVVALHDKGILKKGASISSQLESFLYENGYTCLQAKKMMRATKIN
ncbi:hypothetical protein [Desulfobacula sp.]|uniref:hypothetical protein n=1 Tax=Desulfobacula sp. TaxID=2593537 RepID=UPI00263161F8|nr:hypothetical protein [Desulfobacula sp.]